MRRHPEKRSRVPVPSVVPQHPEILGRLRAMHSQFDYYVEQDGTVLLLWQDQFAERVQAGRTQLLLAKAHPELFLDTLDARLLEAGFSIAWEGPNHALWSGLLFIRAAEFLRRTRKQAQDRHREELREADGTAADERAVEIMRDRIYSESKSDFAILFKGRRTVSGRIGNRPGPVRFIDRRSGVAVMDALGGASTDF